MLRRSGPPDGAAARGKVGVPSPTPRAFKRPAKAAGLSIPPKNARFKPRNVLAPQCTKSTKFLSCLSISRSLPPSERIQDLMRY